MNIGPASAEDRDELLAVYDICFPGEHEYGEYFFDNFWRPERTLIDREDGRIAAMLHMLKTSMTRAGTEMKASYIYAAATLPEYRGRGIMGDMIKRSFELSREWGEQLSILITENDSLFDYYKRFGYKPVFACSRIEADEKLPSMMCKVRMLDTADATSVYALYTQCIAGRAAIARTRDRFEQILAEYKGHAFGLFDGAGKLMSYCLMDENDISAKEMIGEGCGYLLYVCSLDPSKCHGLGLPTGSGDVPIGCAIALTEEAGDFLYAPGLLPYINILLN